MLVVLGHSDSLAGHDWVEWDEAKCVDATVTMAVQVNGKVRAKISLAPDAAEDDDGVGLRGGGL